MNTPARLAAFALALVAVFAAALGVGTAAGPGGPAAGAPGAGGHAEAGEDGHAGLPSADTGDAVTGDAVPAGLTVSDRGYTLALVDRAAAAGPATPVSFRVLGPDGRPVTDYEASHDEDLHLIAVRRDLSGFQHVHPTLGADGTWATPLALTPGSWRLFADFVPGSDAGKLVLGADLDVPGAYTPLPLPAPVPTAEVDGYTVTLEGDLTPGRESELTLTVSRDGRPVTDLQPYLAAYGHLVALRDGDLAYLHVHPAGEPGDGTTSPGPDITFYATAPSAGDYRLFLDFQHGDVVRTAEFTVRAGEAAAPVTDTGSAGGHTDDGHAHG